MASLTAAGFIVTVTAIVPPVRILSPSEKLRALIGTGAFAGFCIASSCFGGEEHVTRINRLWSLMFRDSGIVDPAK